ncbi:NUDIX hydrolase [Microvirga rosea]|uniref:NUDIX hydrolase n=1 Tax=Microvirga rosea TaxID=2715425 RepID=UPI001D0B4391|nr:NUDIX hydrolase [Microvirga rosea]MCB8819097.1 NUDIX hydrolase [Microvirga rosea]
MRCRTLSSSTIYEDPWTRVVRDDVRWDNGHEGQYTVVVKPPGISVIALTAAGTVILTREFRYALGDYSVEAVSGAIEPGEQPIAAAQRELIEEIGLKAEKMTPLGLVHPFTAGVSSPSHLFLAEGLSPATSNPDPGEDIEPVEMSLSDAVAEVVAARIVHAPTCVSILLVERYLAAR